MIRWPVWVASFAVFTIPLGAGALMEHQTNEALGSWPLAVLMLAPYWYGWAALVPLLIWIGTRFPLVEPGGWRRAPAYLVLLGVVAGLHAGVAALFYVWRAPVETEGLVATMTGMLLSNADFELLFFSGALAISQGLEIERRSRLRRLDALSSERELSNARLEALTRQLQPHFLFNVLHAVSSVAVRDPATASRMILKLRDLLRHSLAEGSGTVTLQREIELLEDYLAIEMERFPDRLRVSLDVESDARSALVPRLILQPLVENAVRHGVAPCERMGHVAVEIRRAGDRLRIRVADDGQGMKGNGSIGSGVGLSNTRLRLQTLYGDRHRVEVRPNRPSGCCVELEVPFELSPRRATPAR